jgi:hypothetical protein
MAAGSYAGGGVGGYGRGNTSTGTKGKQTGVDEEITDKGWKLEKLKRCYLDYLGSKRAEIEEQQDARRFRHASQWTSEQQTQLKARRQPIVTINKVSRKIHGVIGVISRLKQDPKAYARTPQHEQGAEIATASVRYVLDANQFDFIDPYCGEMAAIDGIAGVELNLTEGDVGDPDIEIIPFITDSFFYDPRSYKPDFSDARYMGVGKWYDVDEAISMWPEHEEALRASQESGTEYTSDPDREYQWYHTEGDVKNTRLRVVECWYKQAGEWRWCIFTADLKLDEGDSYLHDEKGRSMCKYIAFSAYVDQDGDRYGFVRDLKDLQSELNMRRSKALFTMLGRRIIAEHGAFDDIEKARREASRTDGVVIRNKGFEVDFDDQMRLAETNAQFQFYESTKEEIESFGPNVAISSGEGLERSSGRAIHLLQQAGLADLGPFLQSYRAWKLRLYRAVWSAILEHWQAERWIRVTDDDDLPKFLQINGMEVDEITGLPSLVNELGSLDIDIIMDEGPDTVNLMADAYDTLEVLAQRGAEIPPEILIELSPLPVSVKKRLLEKLNPPPPPDVEMMKKLEMMEKQTDVQETEANTKLKEAQAYKAMVEANAPPEQGNFSFEQPEDQRMTQADIMDRMAGAEQKRAQAQVAQYDAQTRRMQAQNQSRKTEADVQKQNLDVAMRPYEVQQEQYKQGMDFALKREQIRKTPVGRE